MIHTLYVPMFLLGLVIFFAVPPLAWIGVSLMAARFILHWARKRGQAAPALLLATSLLVQQGPDLSITATGTSFLGNYGLYTYTVTNNGSAESSPTTLTNPLPPTVQFIAAPTCSSEEQILRCSIPTLAPGSSITYYAIYQVSCRRASTMTAIVEGVPGEMNLANNTAATPSLTCSGVRGRAAQVAPGDPISD